MAVVYNIRHVTTYRYANPVKLDQHRAMFLPRVGAGGRLFSYAVKTNVPSKIRWTMDALSNNVALIDFSEPTNELAVTFELRGAHYGAHDITEFPIDPRGKLFPIQYTPDEWTDLAAFIRPHAEDPDGSVAAWARNFLKSAENDAVRVFSDMMDSIRDKFEYRAREAQGTQSPGQTLSSRAGSCRDFAWLMIEALRRLGVACRFTSGYLYDQALDGAAIATVGSSSTHAWVLVYLPGAGWVQYDPTNRLSHGFQLIPVATARHPQQAVPLQGSWFGSSSDYLGMNVDISIHKVGEFSDGR